MLDNIKFLEKSASKILAVSALELFPGSLKLLGGGVNGPEFYYLFQRGPAFELNPELLLQLEEKMRMVTSEKREIAELEMVGSNAASYLKKLGLHAHYSLVQYEKDKEIVCLVKLGDNFIDFDKGPFLADTKGLAFFKLLSYEYPDENTLRVSGAAFPSKELLREYLKALKGYPASGYYPLALKQRFFLEIESQHIWLPRGVKLKEIFLSFLKEKLEAFGYQLISGSGNRDKDLVHFTVWEKAGICKSAEIFENPDLSKNMFLQQFKDVEYAYLSKKDIYTDCISLLQFILKLLKIFNFKFKIFLFYRDFTFKQALEESRIEISYIEKKKENRVLFLLQDKLGREYEGANLSVYEAERLPNILKSAKKDNCSILKSSIFGFLEQFMLLALENLNGWLPFWASPGQFRIFSIGKAGSDLSQRILALLNENGYRADLFYCLEGLDRLVYEAADEKIPYGLFIGESEVKDGTVKIRNLKDGNSQIIKLDKLLDCFEKINMRSKEENA